ncbi:MAG TPA: Gfo/Idh/MocA family oxidoreductase [Actinomycetota bacterium]|nr:Gfo/Idh/MocA family oxidoreductase [Actinomycetota bacterium]
MTRLPVAVIGTSWWADAMYMPALTASPLAQVVAVCGRDRSRTERFAERWRVPRACTDPQEVLDPELCRAVVIASPNDTHRELAWTALDRGLHVLCEKPLALTYADAAALARLASRVGATTLVPFTYRYMPTTRFVKRLIDEGYLGRPHHLNMRYFCGFGMSGEYLWRMDRARAGSGVLGDLGSHFLHLAEWFFGDVRAVACELGTLVSRPAVDPTGLPYEPADDVAVIVLRFANGARGVIHVSAVAHEPTPFAQIHEMDLHGSEGTLHHVIDWDRRQEVRGSRTGEDAIRVLPVPDDLWDGGPRAPVKATYHDVFRRQGKMVGEFVAAALQGREVRPDFGDGARVQLLIEAALRSAADGRVVGVEELESEVG